MRSRGTLATAAALLGLLCVAASASAANLNAYRVKLTNARQLEVLRQRGFDVTEGQRAGGIEIVGTGKQIASLRRRGVQARLLRDRRGRTALRASAAQAVAGWQVWRPFARTDVALSDAAGNPTDNLKTQLEKLAKRYPGIAKLETIGHSINGLPIYAMKVTKNARHVRDGRRPAVLYSATQHAREWLSTEVERRTLRLFLDNYGRKGTAVGTDGQPVDGVDARELTKLVDGRELWFILVCNPDGYDYTFTPDNRLWRKNLHDNNGDGQITAVDGVDPNRNFPTHWNYDDEGSNTDTSSETYRGTGPASEPETKAFISLTKRVHFAFNKNDHTFGPLILWPFGWQIDTHPADEPIMTALAGNDAKPAIPGFDPDVDADLYTTNGETNDELYTRHGTISYTAEGTPGQGTGSGFIFPDDEAQVQADFEKHVQFALDLARSAANPSRPKSHLGNTVPNFVIEHPFDTSFGNPQTVEVDARRDLGRVTVNYTVNGGRTRTASTSEWKGGKRYGDVGDFWYHRVRGKVTGTHPGDDVKVWFSAKGKKSASFTYTVRNDSNARVLLLVQEDYTGNSALPAYPGTNGPFYASYYENALKANNVKYDVYDYDAEGRKAPDPLGVLSHYDAIVWETGNDNVTRPTATPGVAELGAHRTTMAVRDFVNGGGRVALAGVNAGRQYDIVEYPEAGFTTADCDGDLLTTDNGHCNPLSNDFLQYYLGSYVRSDGGGLNPSGGIFPVAGFAGSPFDGLNLTLNGPDSAGNQEGDGIGTGTQLLTSSVLPPDEYPQFKSEQAADWVLPGGAAFDPHSGSEYMYSQNVDQAYKRLTRTVDLTGHSSGQLSFFTSYNTEPGWDFVFVEAHTVGQDDWTTLPDLNGHTSDDVGSSCPSGWSEELHNHLRHYTTYDPTGDGSCTPTGTTGSWNASTGNSGGWQQWNVDLSQFAGKQVEVSIVYATDWGTTTVPGVLVDDATVTVDGATAAQTSFEGDTGGWMVPGAPPEGPATNLNDWIRSTRIPFEDAAVTQTQFGLLFGFGFEGVNGDAARNELMRRTVGYLLGAT